MYDLLYYCILQCFSFPLSYGMKVFLELILVMLNMDLVYYSVVVITLIFNLSNSCSLCDKSLQLFNDILSKMNAVLKNEQSK